MKLKDLLEDVTTREQLDPVNFEDGLRLLEELVSSVETGALPLDKAIRSYEKGVLVVEHLRGLLTGAEEKLKILQKSPGANGGVQSKSR